MRRGRCCASRPATARRACPAPRLSHRQSLQSWGLSKPDRIHLTANPNTKIKMTGATYTLTTSLLPVDRNRGAINSSQAALTTIQIRHQPPMQIFEIRDRIDNDTALLLAKIPAAARKMKSNAKNTAIQVKDRITIAVIFARAISSRISTSLAVVFA